MLARALIGMAAMLAADAQAQAPPALPPELAAHIPRNVQPYFLAFLIEPAGAQPMTPEIFLAHQHYMRRQVEAGTYRLMGPFTDGGRIRGLAVIAARSAEEARTLAESDPAVRAHVFAIEVHSVILPSLDTLRIDYPPR